MHSSGIQSNSVQQQGECRKLGELKGRIIQLCHGLIQFFLAACMQTEQK